MTVAQNGVTPPGSFTSRRGLEAGFTSESLHALGWIKATCLVGCFMGCVHPTKGLCYLLRGKEVEAEKSVPHVGTYWGGWSQWRNRLPHEE
jgi:hypothetical protein